MEQAEQLYNRDVQVAADVGRMAELGKFDMEFTVYGCGEWCADGTVQYHATEEEEKLFEYIRQARLKNHYCTDIHKLSRKTQVPFEMKEEMEQQIKYHLLQQMKRTYGKQLWTDLEPWFQAEPNSAALDILMEYREQVEGYYDEADLQLLMSLAYRAYCGKVLKQEDYRELQMWHKHVRQQMADDPITEGNLARTFYGFCYMENGTQKCLMDAQKSRVLREWEEKLLEGLIPGDILRKTYRFDQFNIMSELRNQFRNWLMTAEDEVYFRRLYEIKKLPGVLKEEPVQNAMNAFTDQPAVQRTVKKFYREWNYSAKEEE